MQGKRSLIGSLSMLAICVAVAANLVSALPAQASGGWGFGMAYGPSVVASCTGYNFVAAKVDIPPQYAAGYVTGVLSNPRTNRAKVPLFGANKVPATGAPTLNHVIFMPPAGTVEGDILHVELTLYATPAGGAVGNFGFSYNCTTGEVIRPDEVQALNSAYGDEWVAVTSGRDTQGNQDVEIWCLDPQGQASFLNMTLSRATLAATPAKPSANKLIDKNNSCRVPVAAYVLTSGEYQITVGPDHTGVVNVMIFTGLEPTDIHFKRFNIDQGY